MHPSHVMTKHWFATRSEATSFLQRVSADAVDRAKVLDRVDVKTGALRGVKLSGGLCVFKAADGAQSNTSKGRFLVVVHEL